MLKTTIFSILCFFSLAFCSFISLKNYSKSAKSIFWIQNKSTHTFTHLYIVASEDGDADDEFEDDGTDHCTTSCADDGNQNSEFDPDEIMDLRLGKGKYDLMLQDKDGKRYVEDDIEYHSKSEGVSEKTPFIIEDSKLREVK